MTFREKLTEMLYERGLVLEHAKEVIGFYEKSLGKEMKDRLDDNVNDYPEAVMITVWMGVCESAVQWIDTEHPQHWARPMFAE